MLESCDIITEKCKMIGQLFSVCLQFTLKNPFYTSYPDVAMNLHSVN